jgi:hypothetical protein
VTALSICDNTLSSDVISIFESLLPETHLEDIQMRNCFEDESTCQTIRNICRRAREKNVKA